MYEYVVSMNLNDRIQSINEGVWVEERLCVCVCVYISVYVYAPITNIMRMKVYGGNFFHRRRFEAYAYHLFGSFKALTLVFYGRAVQILTSYLALAPLQSRLRPPYCHHRCIGFIWIQLPGSECHAQLVCSKVLFLNTHTHTHFFFIFSAGWNAVRFRGLYLFFRNKQMSTNLMHEIKYVQQCWRDFSSFLFWRPPFLYHLNFFFNKCSLWLLI